MWEMILHGAVGGLAYSLSGLANKDKKEGFDWKKMLPTMVIAVIVGGIAGYTGQDYGFVANSAAVAGFTVIAEKAFKGIFRKK